MPAALDRPCGICMVGEALRATNGGRAMRLLRPYEIKLSLPLVDPARRYLWTALDLTLARLRDTARTSSP